MSDKDADVTNDGSPGTASIGPVGVSGEWNGSTTAGALTVGGYDLLRLDPMNDIPALSPALTALRKAPSAFDDGNGGELAAIAGSVIDLGLSVRIYYADPLNWLISAGLGFLVDVVQPLEDMIGLVTGNAERMATEVAKWTRVADALGPLAGDIRQAADQGLADWTGAAADAAKARLHEFADGVHSLTSDVGELKLIVDIAKTLMETAQALVISTIATFVEWLVYTWTAAAAAAVPTAGASTAAAAAATGIMSTVAATRIAGFISRVVVILKRLQLVLKRLHKTRMASVQTDFQRRAPNGQFAPGWRGYDENLKRTMTDWRTWIPPGAKVLAAGVEDGINLFGQHNHDKTDEEQRKAWDAL